MAPKSKDADNMLSGQSLLALPHSFLDSQQSKPAPLHTHV